LSKKDVGGLRPALAVRWLLNQMLTEIGNFYRFHVKINKLRKRTLNFGLIANPFYFVVLKLLGGFVMPQQLLFCGMWQAFIRLGCSQEFAPDQVPDRTLGQTLGR
jgi:hypothetical protein